MKLSSLITLGALGLMLVAMPQSIQAKEQVKSRHVVVGGVNKGSHNKGHASSHQKRKYHNGHRNQTKHNYHNGQRNHTKHNYHKGNRHYKKHHGHKHRRYRNNWGSFWLGAAIGHSVGIHGSWYNGHRWCPSHSLYHTHSHYGSYHNNHDYNDYRRKVASYVELDEDGKCFRVSEYSNGDERKKRIRDHYCADLEEWDDWDDLE